MSILEIIKAGPETTLQDRGRPGHRAVGIPQSGAADRLSFAIANHLAGNIWHAPALEITMGGLAVKALEDVQLAISGADMSARCDGKPAPRNKRFTLKAGQILRFGFAPQSSRAYLAVSGGIDGEVFAGSRSTYAPAKLGGIKGRPLKAGDILSRVNAREVTATTLPDHLLPQFAKAMVLRMQKGCEFLTHLKPDTQRRLFTDSFTARADCNRMGANLICDGADLGLSNLEPLTSSPLLPGTLQITPNGTPILTGIDSHCTGGYARALNVIPADHWLLGQIAPGTRLYFRRVTTPAAQEALKLRNKIYGAFIPDFRFD